MATIKYFGKLKQMVGSAQEVLPVADVRAMLVEIRTRYGEEAYHTAKKGHIIVDGENAGSHGGFHMKLVGTSTVHLLPVCGGG